MIRRLLARRHRPLFFAGLYLAYLLALYGLAGVRDGGDVSRAVARLALAAVELGLCGLLCAASLKMARRGPRWPWLLAGWAVAALAAAVYTAQVYSLYLSDNFISALALENADSVAFVASPVLLAGALAAATWLALFCAGTILASRDAGMATGAERWSGLRFGAALCVAALLCTYALFLQDKNQRLEPGFRQAPLVNLAVNLWHARLQDGPEAPAPAVAQAPVRCFPYPAGDVAPGYPFQQRSAYRAPLAFPARGSATRPPNILVIFSEGVSARLVGAYGGRYPGLTPNIDALAARSMQVEDYFNHTAATFRGLAGQLSSGFSYAGGGGKEGWTKVENQAALARVRRQTLPLIVRAAGYDSYFFAPHQSDRPLILMLRSLGFDRVFDYRAIARGLLGGHAAGRPGTGALSDQSLFRGLIAFLRRRAASGDDTPFFAATYNIGTHAFLADAPGDVRYPGSDNAALGKLHNYDAAFGEFLRYFEASPWAANTLLVFTSDHATYPEPSFREVAGDDLKPYFVDRIPLLVLDPFHRLPKTLDAHGRNSLDLAPTVLQLAGLQTRANSFVGRSLFEPRSFPTGIAAIASKYYLTSPDGVFAQGEIPGPLRATFACEVEVVRHYYQAERANRLFLPELLRPDGGTHATAVH